MPNIISGRCPRTEERHSRLCYNDRCYQKRIDSLDNLSEPSSVMSEDVCHEEQATGGLAKGARRTTTLRLLLRFMQGNHSNSRVHLTRCLRNRVQATLLFTAGKCSFDGGKTAPTFYVRQTACDHLIAYVRALFRQSGMTGGGVSRIVYTVWL